VLQAKREFIQVNTDHSKVEGEATDAAVKNESEMSEPAVEKESETPETAIENESEASEVVVEDKRETSDEAVGNKNGMSDEGLKKEKPGGRGAGMAFLAFVIALAALAFTVWTWWQSQNSSNQETVDVAGEIARLDGSDRQFAQGLQGLRTEVETLASRDNSSDVARLRGLQDTSAAELAVVKQALNEQRALTRSLQSDSTAMKARILATESAVAGVASSARNAGTELYLEEVDFLLRLAIERLQLFSDPMAADRVLEVADAQLAELDNPAYLGVRQEIAQARQNLASVNMPDYFDISSQLGGMQQSVLALPFLGDAEVPVVNEGVVEEGWWAKFKGVFSNLVTVRRSTPEENERVTLEAKDFLRQRLWLQLEMAHLSLMRRDQVTFRQALAQVKQTLSTSFDQESTELQALENNLAALASIVVQPDLPDISSPWSTLRQIRDFQARPVAAAVALPAENETAAEVPPPSPESSPVQAGPLPAEQAQAGQAQSSGTPEADTSALPQEQADPSDSSVSDGTTSGDDQG
jgi:uroporphyrin-3 C-methyltransferase